MTSPIACLPDLGRRTLVMGILNVTPDSFSDGGRFDAVETAVAQAEKLFAGGADIVDVGGESTRPGHVAISAQEEQERIMPVIERLVTQGDVVISVDTYKASTARLALEKGAKILNDVWGLQRDPEMAFVAAEFDVPIVVMHNRQEIDPDLDVMAEMKRFFDRSLALASKAGIRKDNIILDPGIGFGKSLPQQVEALRRLNEIRAWGFPVLVGVSRKSMLGRLAGVDNAPHERLIASLAAHVMAIAHGADIVRVHDVREHVEACRIADAIKGISR